MVKGQSKANETQVIATYRAMIPTFDQFVLNLPAENVAFFQHVEALVNGAAV